MQYEHLWRFHHTFTHVDGTVEPRNDEGGVVGIVRSNLLVRGLKLLAGRTPAA